MDVPISAMLYSDDTVFGAAPGPAPLSQRWGDEVVVYHPLSADTHLLEAATASLLGELQQGPQPLGEIRRAFLSEHSAAGDENSLRDYLDEALQQLLEVDLLQVLEVPQR